VNDAQLEIITARSEFGNCITALETGYLIQDVVVLILIAYRRSLHSGGERKTLAKEINWKILGWHHIGLVGALGILQRYIAHGRERGILIILMLMLMNAS
jgi:hypothetical protein